MQFMCIIQKMSNVCGGKTIAPYRFRIASSTKNNKKRMKWYYFIRPTYAFFFLIFDVRICLSASESRLSNILGIVSPSLFSSALISPLTMPWSFSVRTLAANVSTEACVNLYSHNNSEAIINQIQFSSLISQN